MFFQTNWIDWTASDTLQGTNITPQNGILKMIFLFPRWDVLIPWRVFMFMWSKKYLSKTCRGLDLRNPNREEGCFTQVVQMGSVFWGLKILGLSCGAILWTAHLPCSNLKHVSWNSKFKIETVFHMKSHIIVRNRKSLVVKCRFFLKNPCDTLQITPVGLHPGRCSRRKEPENTPLEKENHLNQTIIFNFSGSMLIFESVTWYVWGFVVPRIQHFNHPGDPSNWKTAATSFPWVDSSRGQQVSPQLLQVTPVTLTGAWKSDYTPWN